MKKWIVANWKMNGSKKLLHDYQQFFDCTENLIVCPSAILLNQSGHLTLGAQNIYHQPNGAYTGEISASMLTDIGVKYCLVGHSERRQYFGETNEIVRKKVELCIENSITPIICIGETFEQYETGQTLEVLETQLSECLPSARDFWIAYEPIWAIGTGLTPTSDEITSVHTYIKGMLPSVTLLYGGSVNADNATAILSISNVDGALVGGASLDLQKISQIHQTTLSI